MKSFTLVFGKITYIFVVLFLIVFYLGINAILMPIAYVAAIVRKVKLLLRK